MDVHFGPSLPSQNLSFSFFCKECKKYPTIFEDYKQGYIICSDCGLVLCNSIVDTRSEWRTFPDTTGADMCRIGSTSNELMKSSNIEITQVSGSETSTLKKTQKYIMDSKDFSLHTVFKDIDILILNMKLNDLIGDTAKQIYREAYVAKLIRKGKSKQANIAACTLIACRKHKVARSFKEINKCSLVSIKDIRRAFENLKSIFTDQEVTEEETVTDHLDSYMSRFCSSLGASFYITRKSTLFAKKITSMGLFSGRSPTTVAAACLFFTLLVEKEPKTIRDVSTVTGCGEPTLRDAYRKLYEMKDTLAPGCTEIIFV